MSWKELQFKDFVTLQRGFDLPKLRMMDGVVPVLGSNCVIGFHNEAKVGAPGVVTGRSGTLGWVQYSEQPFWPHNTALWVKDFKGNNPRFVYYKLQTLQLERFNGGASVPTLNRNVLDTIPVRVPDPTEQARITSILSTYDDLIENNRRRIQLLEQAARLLYKEWFVHFRFPGHEHNQITNGIPDGWSKKPLSDIANITMGQSPKSIYYNQDGEGLPFHQGVTNFGDRFPAHETYCTVENRIAEPGDILFSVRAPVGRINITPTKIVIGRGLAAIRSKYGSQNLLFYALKSHFFKEDMIGGGAIFAAITKKDIHNIELLQPDEIIAQTFTNHIKPIDWQLETLWRFNVALARTRDLLLPRLMNGDFVCRERLLRRPDNG